MKLIKYFTFLVIFIATAISVSGQVMISQYIDTDSGTTPKGIEVYNHSASTIDFSVQNLEVYLGSNGNPCASLTGAKITSGTLAPNEVWVIGTSDLITAASTGSNLGGSTTYGFNFNGNDAIELYLDGDLMDVIGECGSDPGSSWSGSGVSTADQNISIKPGICSGSTAPLTDPSLRFEKTSNGVITTGFGDSPACSPLFITTSFIPTTFTVACITSYTGTVSFNSNGDYNSGNTFSVQISDLSGSFSNPTVIGSISQSGTDPANSISITVPANYYSGTEYRMRVVSTDPIVNGANNGHDIEIINSSPCDPTIPDFGGIIINEFSNGPSSSQEYYELVVAGECGETTDIRGYIIDDNNGDFGSGGIAPGHLKISNHAQWSNIEVGSIIVVYNSSTGERNPHISLDDLTDSDADLVYIIPFNDPTYLSLANEFPNSSDNSYSPDVNPPPNLTNFTNRIGFNNIADVAQTRKPNGDYFFGISYGVGNNGGVDNTKISNSDLTEKNVYFNSGDFRNINNWSVGDATNDGTTTDETPGAANNSANQGWIDMLRSSTGSCGLVALPVKMLRFEGEFINREVELYWKTATELNNNYYELFHSKTGYDFESIALIDGHGTVNSPKEYNFKHRNSSSGIHYYRLKSVDYNGKIHENGTISVQIERDEIHYDSNTQTLHFPGKGEYHVYSTSGQKIFKAENKAQISFSKKGFFLIYNAESGVVTKIVI
ncbi:lamin tail domain-containing protein [Brumimicrobium glaciale]|uniref:Lamin tail domain-containing protein n=1 Tax=Brumimicrobium glaciale TaxID=200475 RepID=A0A4V1WG12_9FLAO|nr:lamin tail domain-containing protein [Brumimicrobium glaciale]RYM35086.1 lamin tail domain-containing protein [Brumimicrobium glaciale]